MRCPAPHHSLRKTHLALLLHHPSSTYAQSLYYMWLSTTHGVTRAYRAQVLRAEERVGAAAAGGAAHGTASVAGGRRRRQRGDVAEGDDNNTAAAALKKIGARFRAFLAGEVRAYTAFIAEFVRVFGLAGSGVAAEGEGTSVSAPRSESALVGWLRAAGVSLAGPADAQGTGPSDGSSADADDAPLAASPAPARAHAFSPEERAKKVGLVHKALVCLGDLERYREQYGPRPAATAQAQQGTERYAVARRYYEVARGLLPENGGLPASWSWQSEFQGQ